MDTPIQRIADVCADENADELRLQLEDDREEFAETYGRPLDELEWLESLEPWQHCVDAVAQELGRELTEEEDAAFCAAYREALARRLGIEKR